MANEKKSSKINIISNEKITNFSDYLKASNLTSKKEILFKGLSNNVTLKNKFNLNNTPKKIIKKEINSSSSDEEANVLKSVKNVANKSKSNHVQPVIKKEIVSETEPSSDEERNIPKKMLNGSSKTNKVNKKMSLNTKSSDEDNKDNISQISKGVDSIKQEQDDSSSDSNGKSDKEIDKKSSLLKYKDKTAESNIKLAEFITNTKLTSLHSKLTATLDNVEGDCDIFLVQIPKSINPNILLNQAIELNEEETKIKTEEGNYAVNLQNLQQEPSIFLSNESKTTKKCGAKVIHPKGVITVHQSLKSKKNSNVKVEEEEETNVPYPSNLKVRHPIFGINYEKKITVSDDVQRKLSETVNINGKKSKKRRHSIAIKVEEQDDTDILANIFKEQEIIDEPQKKQKKRKSKNKSNEEISDLLDGLASMFDTSNLDLNITQSKVTKRRKSFMESIGINDGEVKQIKIEDAHLANSTMINNRTICFDNDLSKISITDSVKKKKNKHKNVEDDTSKLVLNQLEMELKNVYSSLNNCNDIETACKLKKKKKKKKHEDADN